MKFQIKNKFLNALTIALILFQAVAPISALAWVGTDQADYSPGSVVTISGDNSDGVGYLATETVHVDVTGPNGYTAACDAVADDNGAWSCQVTLWASDLAIGAYAYAATGHTSGVSQTGTFTDAPAQITVTANPFAALGGTFKITRVQTNNNTQTSGGTTLQIFTAKDNSNYSVFDIQSTVNGCTYTGSSTISGVTGGNNSNAIVTLQYSCVSATSLSVSPATGTYGGSVNLSATLTKNSDSSAVSGKSISFTLNGSSVGSATTNGSGVATLSTVSLAGINVGTYNPGLNSGIGVSFAGDPSFGASNGTAILTVNQASSTVTVTCTAGAPYIYNGSAQTPCTAQATGVGMSPVDVTASLVYSNNTDAGSATAQATWAGDTNHTGNIGNGGFTIGQASSTVTVTCTAGAPYIYNGSAQTPCTAQATGVGMSPVDVTASLVYSNNTDAGSATAQATWAGDTNHTGNTGNGGFTIAKANAVFALNGYAVTYDGFAHTATGTATGVLGESLSGLDFSGTTHTNAIAAHTDSVTFTDVTGNYNDDATLTVTDSIAKANAVFALNGYAVTYDGFAHTATGTATGVLGESLSGLDFSGTTHANAIAAHSDSVTFTDVTGNYNDDATLTVTDSIAKANADCSSITGYTGTYNAVAHGASGSCKGVNGETLAGLDLGASFTDVPGGTANWTFTDVTGNYNDDSGTAAIVITKADATCNIVGYTANYDGASHGASGSCSGIGGETAGTLNLGASFTDFPGGTAHWAFTGNGNYNNQNGDVAIVFLSWWTIKGFYQPVDMNGVLNTVKGGSTVPLKFEVFAGSTELTNIAIVSTLTKQVACTAPGEDSIEVLATGGTSLRYDTVGGQFIFNWQTPKLPGKCYTVTMTTQDGSSIIAFFKLK